MKINLSITTPSHVSIQMLPDGISVTVGAGPAPDGIDVASSWDHLVKREHMAILATIWHQWVPTVTNVTPDQAKVLWKLWCREPKTEHRGVRFMRKATNRCWIGYVRTN